MTKWKWVLACVSPPRFLLSTRTAIYFWFDRQHLGVIRHFVALRSGLAARSRSHAGAPVFVSVQFGYLLLYAAAVHARRALRRELKPTAL